MDTSWERFQELYQQATESTKQMVDSELIPQLVDDLVSKKFISKNSRSFVTNLCCLYVLDEKLRTQIEQEFKKSNISSASDILKKVDALAKRNTNPSIGREEAPTIKSMSQDKLLGK